jgi:hypothetical protein
LPIVLLNFKSNPYTLKTSFITYTTLLFVLICIVPELLVAQSNSLGSQVNGNFQMDAQYYRVDSAIGALPVPEKMQMNSWTNVTYSAGKFNAGLRFETYLNPINGYDPRYQGTGIPYWFVDYKTGQFQVTAGKIYEQFGSGMIFRTYEEHNLGYDNSLNGIRVKFNPVKGVELKGIYGTQRYFWDQGPGIVRGADADFNLNDLITAWEGSKLRIRLGGSFVSKYQADEDIYNSEQELLILPLNVGAGAGRLNIDYGNFGLGAEYVQKINDPNAMNNFIYKNGESLLLSASYNQKGLGILVQAKRLDNMSYKSKRTETGNVLDINYLPAITKQQTYTLAAFYPYATQPNSEMGIEAQVNYKIKKNTFLGGKYGTDIALNFSAINSIQENQVNDSTPLGTSGTLGYSSPFFKVGDTKYFRDFNIEIGHKFSKSLKLLFTYMYEDYNIAVIEGHTGEPMVHADIFVAELTYKITPEKALRFEGQALLTQQDEGDWMMGLLEYTVAPKWFVSLADQWNYGNPDTEKRFNYPLVAVAYNNDANRIQLSYGKQREGIVCVGGVCRAVPASNGFTLTLTTSF